MVRFTAHTDGKVLVPDEPVDLPQGQRFVVTLEPVSEEDRKKSAMPNWLQKAIKLSEQMPDDLPEDMAEQHDHYIHGTPKR